MQPAIHVISPVGGTGTSLDLELIVPLLKQNGFNVTSYPLADGGKVARSGRLASTFLLRPHRFDVNIFMGPILPELLPMAHKNVWIPNAEGFSQNLHKWLSRIDLVLAKTRMTERIFHSLGCRIEFMSFTGQDRLDTRVARDHTKFYHACRSPFKGTKCLLETWKAHPEWPEIVVVSSNDGAIAASFEAPNIRIIAQHLPPAEYIHLQNSIGFHICCSEAESYGHTIMEAMSCGAVTLTANGSHRYIFKAESLEEQIERAMKLEMAAVGQIGSSARACFLENDQLFRRHFPAVIRSLLPPVKTRAGRLDATAAFKVGPVTVQSMG
jgi:hypothetical protein